MQEILQLKEELASATKDFRGATESLEAAKAETGDLQLRLASLQAQVGDLEKAAASAASNPNSATPEEIESVPTPELSEERASAPERGTI